MMNREPDSETAKSATDPIFKQIITTFFQRWDVDIQTEVEVARLPRRIDAVVHVAVQALHAVRYLTPFWYFLIHNVIEFKGRRDPLTIHGYQQILSRSYQYLAEHKLDNPELTLTIVSARTPRAILSKSYLSFKQIAEGYYFYDNGKLKVYLIATNELPIKPENYSLLLFASAKARIQKIIEDIVRSEWTEYIQFAYLLHPDITEEVAMANRFRLPKRNMELIAQYLGRDLVPFISSEDRLRDLPLEDIRDNLSDEERQALLQLWADQGGLTPAQRLEGLSLEDIRDNLSDEERQALLQLWADQEGLTPAQRLEGLSLEDIRDNLSDEERQALRQLLDGQESETSQI